MLSIILTVYNKEPYLRRALDALLNQHDIHDNDYEVLAVNDGSKDGSATILEEYARRDARIRVLTQQNQGLSMARNNGMEVACGDYVWFVDADDTISEQSVSLILNASSSHPDVIPVYAEIDGIDKVRNKVGPDLKTGKDVLLEAKWEHCGVFWVFRKQFLVDNDLRFVPGIYHEDAEFTPRMLYLAQSVKVVPEILYKVFRGDENSITEVPRPKRSYDMVFVVEQLMAFFESHGEYRTAIDKVMCNNNAGILNTAFYVISCNNEAECDKFDRCLYEKRHILSSFSGASLLKYRLEGCLFRLFPRHCVRVFRLFRQLLSWT